MDLAELRKGGDRKDVPVATVLSLKIAGELAEALRKIQTVPISEKGNLHNLTGYMRRVARQAPTDPWDATLTDGLDDSELDAK